jgi:hypothetical protein
MKQSWQKWKSVASRITGVNIPIIGISWNPPQSDRDAAERAITYLESKGLLYTEFQWENPDQCYADASNVRDEMTRQLQQLSRNGHDVYRQLDAIRDACRVFREVMRQKNLERVVHHSSLSDREKAEFLQALGALRDACGKQIMILAVEYGIDVASHLAACLPDPEETE